jgi:hypothetical protein
MRRTHALILTALAVLAILAYLPVLHQPLLEDDYPNLEQARLFGPVSGWPAMFEHTVFRYRATFYVLTYSLDRLFGPSAAAFYCAGILLHILCTWLVYALGTWRIVGWRISGAAAAFFAVAEGHQEAVMWYSASCELLMVFFGLASLLCWVRFVDKQRGVWWYAASLASFVLALLSKESAVVFAALLWLPLWAGRASRRALALWLPFVGLAAIEVMLIAGGSAASFRFRDGSFSLGAPFWITLPVSYARLLWVWGLAALACVFLLRMKQHRQLLAMSAVWIAIALAPYSFLTYMHRIPSRQTYLASVGLAWIVAAGFWALRPRLRHRRPAALAAVIVLVFAANIGYLWTKKRDQFLRRAAPTEALIAIARKTDRPIYMRCYPGPGLIYEGALRVRTGKPETMLLWEKPANGTPAVDFCWARR